MQLLGAALVFVGLALLFFSARRRGGLRLAFLVVTPAVAALWTLAWVAIQADYRDADGSFDCRPYCTAFQDAVGLATFVLPVAFVAVAISAVVLTAITRTRAQRGE
jgi:hypothetical protein